MRRLFAALALVTLALPSAGCTTIVSVALATEIETTTIDVTQVRAQRIDRGWRIEIDWEDGEGSELEWTPMAVLDEGNVQRTGPLIVPRVGWLWIEHVAARNGLFHNDDHLFLYKNGQQVAKYPIARTEPLPEHVRYTILAGLLPFTVALDLATLPLQLIGGGLVGILILTEEDEDP